jgi:hypothetical protein
MGTDISSPRPEGTVTEPYPSPAHSIQHTPNQFP